MMRKLKSGKGHYDKQEAFEKSIREINYAREQVGLKPLIETTKECLSCDKKFKSYVGNNRLCIECRHRLGETDV